MGDTDELVRRIHALEDQLLRARAELAGGFAPEELPEGDLGVVVCWVGTRRVAFLQQAIETVVRMARLLPLEGAGPSVAGLLSLHGELLPTIDVQHALTGVARGQRAGDMLLVARLGDRAGALLVREVVGIERVAAGSLVRPPPAVTRPPHLHGVFGLGEGETLLLGAGALLARASAAGGAA